MNHDWKTPTDSITPLLDTIIEYFPEPEKVEGTPQMLITSLDFSTFVGRIAIGRISRGSLKENQPVSLVKKDGTIKKMRIKEAFVFEGLGRKKVQEIFCGDLCALTGIEDFDIGDTVADFENPEALKPISVDEPTMSMLFTINNSPFFGKEGRFVTSRHLRDRLYKELEKNLAMRIQETESPDSYLVFGRGVLHLSILIETMRREGYELQVGQPQVIVKEVDGMKHEPVEHLTVDAPEEVAGKVIELVTMKKGELKVMEPKGDLQHLEFEIPARGLIGLRSAVLTATAGRAIMAHRFSRFEPWKGAIQGRISGVLLAKETGTTTAYSIDRMQDRGFFFIEPGDQVYAGQVVGQHIRPDDLVINLCEAKKLTNMRASGSDDNVRIAPKTNFSLEESMEYIEKDEYLEITPKSLRIRKIYLDENERKRNAKKMAEA
jgi:GTP-binding protein